MRSSDLKKLVVELDLLLDSRGGLLDAPARDELKARLDRCLAAIEVAIEEEEKARIRAELYQIGATLVSVFTNVPGGHPNSPTDGHRKLPHLS